MSLMYVIIAVILDLVKLIDAKRCIRIDNYQEFECGMYEYCCGIRCCRSPIITFYQMWYFWLMVFLTILFCSGGGWWYRLRNQDAYMTPSMAQRVTQGRPIIHPARGPTIIAATMPMPTAAPYNVQYPPPPPPPYYGPPPSYDAVVNQNQHQNQPNLNLNQQQNQNLNQQQNQNRTPSQQN